MCQKCPFFSDRADFELKKLIFKCDQEFQENFKRKAYDQQILLKLKLKVKMTYRRFVEDFKWKNSQK